MGSTRDTEHTDTDARTGDPTGVDDVQQAPSPMPEPEEQRLHDPGVRDLSKRDYLAILVRAAKESIADHIPNLAAALAYSAFLAIPAALLITLGVFGLVASPSTVQDLLDRMEGVVPAEAISLLEQPMTNLTQQGGQSIWLVAIGAVLAIWTVSGAMGALMWAMNIAYEREETRGFVKSRLTAIGMFLCCLLAVALCVGLLILGPILSGWVGEQTGAETVTTWAWWAAQWPILIGGLLLAFAGIYYLGPNVDHPRWQVLTLGSFVAVAVWIIASAGFAFYASQFGSYNKTWGSISIVIVTLTWLWITGLAVLFGAEVNAEAERSRELRQGERGAKQELQAPPKA
jgi:membrane protein